MIKLYSQFYILCAFSPLNLFVKRCCRLHYCSQSFITLPATLFIAPNIRARGYFPPSWCGLSGQRNINHCDVHRGVTISVVGLFSWASALVMQRLGLGQPTGHWWVTDVKWACAQLSAWSQVQLIPTRLTETQLTYKCICEKYVLMISVWDFKVFAA